MLGLVAINSISHLATTNVQQKIHIVKRRRNENGVTEKVRVCDRDFCNQLLTGKLKSLMTFLNVSKFEGVQV